MPTSHKPKTAHAALKKALHKQNLNHHKLNSTECNNWNELAQGKTCPECGNPLEVDLWQNIVCGYCKGWRQ